MMASGLIGKSKGLLFALLMIGTIGWAQARPMHLRDHWRPYDQLDGFNEDSGTIGDSSPQGNSPVTNVDPKKVKNASGKSDEGGYYKTYGSDAEGEKGYEKGTYSNGEQGYKTLDTFHKKAADNYGFEEHGAFGKTRAADKPGKRTTTFVSKSDEFDDDHQSAGSAVDTYYTEDDADNAAYTEGEDGGADTSGESSSYTDGADSEHYTGSDDGDAAGFTEGGSDSGNYGNSDGYNEHYSTGGEDGGSYGSHSSYTSGGDSDAFYPGEYY